RRTAPTRRCGKRWRSSLPGTSCGSCGRKWPSGRGARRMRCGCSTATGAPAARAQAGLEARPQPAATPPTPEPSAKARALLTAAGSAESGAARELLQEALADSPAFVEAAAALYALGGTIPASTVLALQDDGPSLLDLALRLRRAGATPALIAP